MANLIYSAITSLDGYVADEEGNFDWAAPDEEVHAFVNDLERPIGTYLYGRRMYEVMTYWETAHAVAGQPPSALDYAEIWRAAEKVVYSTTLVKASTARTRMEGDFDPEEVRDMKASAERDLSSVHHADRGGRRHAVAARRRPYRARARGRTPFRQRRGVPPLPHRDVRRRRVRGQTIAACE
jgi:RibD C-terminal domain